MANPHKGEVELVVGEKTYQLRLSIDAICRLEDATQLGLPILLAKLANPVTITLGLVRYALHVALVEAHPEIDLQAAGKLIIPAGGIGVVMEKITEAIAVAFPEVEAQAAARPPKGSRQRRGTGRP